LLLKLNMEMKEEMKKNTFYLAVDAPKGMMEL
jgi:hypothetical protein